MFLIFLLTLANGFLKTEWINTDYLRFNNGTFPINIFDILIAVGIVASLLPKGQFFFETERPHPALGWTFVLFTLAVLGAGLAALSNGAGVRPVITTARNLIEVPILVYLGYRLTPRPHSAVIYSYLMVLTGIGVAVVISLSFSGQAEDLTGGKDIVTVRVIDFVANYAGLAAALLLFSVGSGAKPLFAPWICVLLAAVCFVGQFSTLSRSDWLAAAAGIIAAIVIMPRYRTGSKIAFSAIVFPVIGIVLFISMLAASAISGKDVVGKMHVRLLTLLPGEHEGDKGAKAWDTRLGGAVAELGLWIRSPLIGRGFGIQDIQQDDAAYRHNTWTSTLAESGLIGFSAMSLICVGQIVIGRRMIRDRLDRSSVLIGGLGVITGVHFIVHGYCTMSFNQVRWAIPLAVTFGVVVRCRAMQQSMAQQYAGHLPDDYQQMGDIAPILGDDEAVPTLPAY